MTAELIADVIKTVTPLLIGFGGVLFAVRNNSHRLDKLEEMTDGYSGLCEKVASLEKRFDTFDTKLTGMLESVARIEGYMNGTQQTGK